MCALYVPQTDLDIDRKNLPQIKQADVPNFVEWLNREKNVPCTYTTRPVADLLPTQGEFNLEKVEHLMSVETKTDYLKQPIIVSIDGYILDGHHRWLALLNMDDTDTMPIILVNLYIRDLIAVAHEYPKSFTKSIVESFRVMNEKHKVLAFGRMNPPTLGHQKLVEVVHEVAKRYRAEHEVILSHTQDGDKNPLFQESKISYAKKMFPGTNIVAASKELPSLFQHVNRVYMEGVKHLHVVMGEDRVEEFREKLEKHNGQFNEQGVGYVFRSITVHSAGHRDPDSDGVDGVSASKVRELAIMGNFNGFKQAIPSLVNEEVQKMYEEIRENTETEEELLTESIHDAGIFKAVFLSGGPGSGKDFVLKKALDGHGLVEIDADKTDHIIKNHGKKVDGKKDKNVQDLRHHLALKGRNGLIINSSGSNPKKIAKIKSSLCDMGYDCKMVFVNTSDTVSNNRNVERGQRGGRMVPEKIRSQKWQEAQDARVELSKIFGTEHYHEFQNDEDLRTNLDPDVHKQKSQDLLKLFKTVKKFTQDHPKHPKAQEWITTNTKKLLRTPVGNKKQQRAVAPPPSTSKAAEEARKLGLVYYGFGKYGKNGSITHFSLHDTLMHKRELPTEPKVKQLKEDVNIEFEKVLEETHVMDSGENSGSPLHFNGGKEEIDMQDGKATTTPKKSFKSFRTKEK